MSSSSSLHAGSTIVTEAEDESAISGGCDGVVHGELENQEDVKRMSLSSFHLWALGISIVIGGQYIGWNEVLLSGFGSALIATVLISSGYVCLVLCIAELSSAIPFGGNISNTIHVVHRLPSLKRISPLNTRRILWHRASYAWILSRIHRGFHGGMSEYHICCVHSSHVWEDNDNSHKASTQI